MADDPATQAFQVFPCGRGGARDHGSNGLKRPVDRIAVGAVRVRDHGILDTQHPDGERRGKAELTVTMSPAPEAPQELTYTIETDGDDATADADADDYTASGSVTIPAGADGEESSTAVIRIEVTDDDDIDAGARETMVVRLTPSTAPGSADSGGVSASAVVIILEGICDRSPDVQTQIKAAAGLPQDTPCHEVTDITWEG